MPRSKPIACRRCHARKVKCSGGQPCTNCSNSTSSVSCVYPARDRQIKVSQIYIDELLEENQRLRGRSGSIDSKNDVLTPSTVDVPSRIEGENEDSARNPLFEDRPWFFPINTLDIPIHIGEAADASFSTRFRQALSGPSHSHIPRTHYVPDEILMSLSDTDCSWPAPARARFLVKVSLNTICRCYHIVRKSVVLDGLELAISNPSDCDKIFISKLWALFALGEAYSTRTSPSEASFPGLAYFAKASRVLRALSERPRVESIEIMLLLSLYSLALNRRHSAYFLAGSAIRLCTVMGLHVNIPESQLSDIQAREHLKRLWWTAYVFDRMWASKLGHPVSVQDDDIESDLPSSHEEDGGETGDFEDPAYYIATIRLATLASHVINSLYRRRKQQGSFSQRVQQTLRNLRTWVEELPSHLKIDRGESRQMTPHRVVFLHLSFNQCVVLATRPILLHVLRTYRESWTKAPDDPKSHIPDTALALAEACIRCARHSYRLLTESWINGSFSTFDYPNTQYLFSAATILAIASLLDKNEDHNDSDDFETAAQILSQLEQNGNFAAKEFSRHIDAMKTSIRTTDLQSNENIGGLKAIDSVPTARPGAISTAYGPLNTGSMVTAGMALAEPSLQEFLSQPDFDLRFIDTSIYNDGLQSLYWPEFQTEGWMSG